VAIGGYLAAGLLSREASSHALLAPARAMLLPGRTTHGHHQIELACESCHAQPFGGRQALQSSCERCHAAELKAANDTHPRGKFTDPRNADRLERLDATLCVTCHVEHRPELTRAMGLTLAGDFCFHCHAEIAKDRPSHAGLGFDGCNGAGCHKFHDNRSLYEDFLARHLDDPALAAQPRLRARGLREALAQLPDYPAERYPLRPLSRDQQDAPAGVAPDAKRLGDWSETTHAAAGVNCSACHQAGERSSAWVERPGDAPCASCHAIEAKGFRSGKHGMRLAEGLSAMTPARARLPMRDEARGTALGCTSCHEAHRFDTHRAALEACLGCHRDRHSLAYQGSPHHALWKKELAGEAPAGSGVSCASCHLPRLEHRLEDLGIKRTLVEHNQNATLQPNEKMIRPVCLSCHGLGFALDALADRSLVQSNFAGKPRAHVKTLDMVAERARQLEAKRNAAKPGERNNP
jgi:hypothetical protein